MKKILIFTMVTMFLAPTVMYAEKAKKPKEKKAKKEFVWELPEQLSGNADFDEYLLSCDTLWNNIQLYSDGLENFNFRTDTLFIDGKLYEMAYMLNSKGELVTKGQVNWELANAIMSCTNLLLDCTNVGLLTATATLALTDLGLNSIKYAKYLKLGPKVLEKGKDELTQIVKIRKSQLAKWRQLKANALTREQVSTFGEFSDSELKKVEKCIFIKEMNTEETMTIQEESKQNYSDAEKLNQFLIASVEAPEEEGKSLREDDIDESLLSMK